MLKCRFRILCIIALISELIHGIAIDPYSRASSAPKILFGRHKRAVSALKSDVKRYGTKQNHARAFGGTDSETLIGALWNENQDLVWKFLNNEFLKFQAEGNPEDTIPSYQYYTIQDYYYLVDYVQYKALRMTTFSETFPTQLLSVLEQETESIQGDIDYAWSTRNETLVTALSVPAEVIDSGKRGVAQLAYSDWLQKNLDLGWFTLHVMSIPCLYGWVKLAEHWDTSNATRKDTVFYKTWIEPNLDPIYGNELMDFLEANKDAYYSANNNQTWTSVFRQALQFEIDLFDSALGSSLEDLA